ncbi:isthmin-1 [Arapaima gigas]
MVRLGAELALLLGLLLLTLHITVLRSSPAQPGNASSPSEQHHLNALPAQDPHGESGSSSRLTHGDRRSAPFSHRRTQPHSNTGVLQRDGPGAFLLDLHNFPDLSKTDINGQNPNIQVTIEVVDGLEVPESEKELRKESKPAWATPNWRNWWQRSSSAIAARRPEEPDYPYEGDADDSNFLKPMTEWEQRGGGSKMHTEYVNAVAPPSQLNRSPRRRGFALAGPEGTLERVAQPCSPLHRRRRGLEHLVAVQCNLRKREPEENQVLRLRLHGHGIAHLRRTHLPG